MPSVDTQLPLLPSVLDRLIDSEPDQTREPLWRGSYRIEELREHLRRDLEFLLNSRHGRYDLLAPPRELSVSVLAYGLGDFTGLVGGGGSDTLERIRATVQRAIADYEPRLQGVTVEVGDMEHESDRNIRLTIRATLNVHPVVEPVTFDTTVEAVTGTCQVRPN
jgi:type VI secretion system protein ImpF